MTHNSETDNRLQAELGSVSAPDFSEWCRKFPDAVAGLQESSQQTPLAAEHARDLQGSKEVTAERKKLMSRMKWLTAAILVLITGFSWLNFGGVSLDPKAFADEIPGIDQVRQMTWTMTFYVRVISRDGKTSWIEKEDRLFAYRHPGQYRETRIIRGGEVYKVVISDHNAGRMIELLLKDKKAALKTPEHKADPRGPFAWYGDALRGRDLPGSQQVKSVSMQGQATVDDSDANVARVIIVDSEVGKRTRLDMYFDSKSKQLAAIWSPNSETDELEELEKQVRPPQQDWGSMEPLAALIHNIQLKPMIEASEFSLDAPKGYALETIAPPTVTEDEMLEYVRAAVAFNNNTFPDSLFNAFDSDKLNTEWAKKETDRSAAASDLISQVDKFRLREIYQSPVQRFVTDNTVPDSFQFAASGATAGKADQIICWYRLKHSKELRAVFGDLSVRDISESELPFSITK